MSERVISHQVSRHRYLIHSVRWARIGPRSGWLRRRRWQQRIWKYGEANDLSTANALLTACPLYADEAVFLYDNGTGGWCIGARMGARWAKS